MNHNIKCLKNIKKYLLILMCFVSPCWAGAEDRTYESIRLEIAAKIEHILISESACKDRVDCQKKMLFYVSPAKSGINVQLYSLINMNIARRVANECVGYYISYDGKINIEIDIFRISKAENISHSFWEAKYPKMQIKFLKEN